MPLRVALEKEKSRVWSQFCASIQSGTRRRGRSVHNGRLVVREEGAWLWNVEGTHYSPHRESEAFWDTLVNTHFCHSEQTTSVFSEARVTALVGGGGALMPQLQPVASLGGWCQRTEEQWTLPQTISSRFGGSQKYFSDMGCICFHHDWTTSTMRGTKHRGWDPDTVLVFEL